MSVNRLQKYINKQTPPLTGSKQLVPVLLSDSKGRYLEEQRQDAIDYHIKFWYKGGRTTAEGLQWLQDNLSNKVGHLDNLSVYIWLGTCDFTNYDKDTKYITLQDNQEEAIKAATENLTACIELIKSYPSCKATILEIPPYSIYIWNRDKKHPEPNSFINEDSILARSIEQLNTNIRELNHRNRAISPIFAVDISHIQVKTTNNRHRRLADNYNFTLYKDGIHPDVLLARVWLRKLGRLAFRDCFSP